jgi:asparagine synthase (glutamine-hydrolysing)
LTTEINEVRLFFSFFPDCLTLGLRHFSVNWRFIARYLTKVNYTAETGLSEVTEIRCGECMVLSRDSASRSMYWEPLAIARSHVIEDPLRASRALNRIVKACVHAWASEHQVLALRLSGGLDSSIVLGCLKDAPHRPTVVCINRYSAGADGDERDFARLAAEHAGCQLIELPRDPTFRIEDALTAHASAAPSNYLMQLGQGRAEADMARASGATGIFTGTYGDQLFFGPNAQLSVVDYLKRHPLSLNVFKVALSAARLEGRSIWSILAEALPAAFRTEEWDPVAASRPFDNLLDEATVRARQGDAQGETPWYSPLQYVPPGKQFHIHSLSSPDGYYSPFEKPNDPCYVSPLMSQPIVELCLRIPTYLLTSNGWDRELARRSFLQEVPARILRRRSKGGQEEYTTQVFSRNRQFMREIFLGGDLLAQGLLDRKKLSEALSHRPSGVLKGTARMSKYLSIELWLRLCTRESARLVA